MNAHSIPPIVMAGIALYVASYQLLIYAWRKDRREYLTFGLSCLAVAFYDVCCAGLYSATSVAEGAGWQHVQFVALAFVAVAFLWFIVDYTGYEGRRALYALSGCYGLLGLIQIVDRGDLTVIVDAPSIKHIQLPLGPDITYYEATPGPVTNLQSLLGVAIIAYLLRVAWVAHRRGHRRQAVPLLAAMALFAGGVVSDTLVSVGAYSFVYLIEYSYMGIVLLMAYSLSRTVVEATTTKEALRASEERFRALVETSSDWIWETDRNGVYTYASPQVTALLGYQPEEVVGRTPFDLMPADEARRVAARFRAVVEASKPFEGLENRSRRKDGRVVVLETNGVPFFDARGELRGYRGTDRDVTERKRAEQALQESEEKYRSVVENSPTGIFLVNDVYTFVYANDELCRMVGCSPDGIIGHDFREFLDDESRAIVADRYLRRQRGEEVPDRYEFNIVRPDGGTRRAEISSAVIRDSLGHLLTMGQLLDITERKTAEAEREQLILELEQRNAELECFTYTVSHDLKSPLVTIAGFLTYLEKDARAGNVERVRTDVQRISQAAEQMQRLLRDLLELSRIGRLMNPPEAVPFAAVVEEASRLVHGRIAERGVRLEVVPGLPVVSGDRARLVEVVQNLVDNACKFMGGQREPRVTIGHRGDDGQGGPILFVRDNGVGIDPRYHDRVFGLFDKLDPQSEGTGIGLALVKRIVEVHGGRIWVESEPGKGSTFCFTIKGPPLAPPP